MTFPEILVRLREMLIPTLYQARDLKQPGVLKADVIAGITVALVL